MTSGNIVKLDIGGTLFKTSKSTLRKFDGFFKTMLDTSVPLEKDDSGAIFIDRDPKYLRLILNYMRDGLVNIPDSKSDIQEIQVEAQYYLLDGLVELCAAKLSEQLPIIENDAHLLNLVALSEKTGKRVLVIYKNIAGKINHSEPTFNIKTFMEKHKDNFDIWFRTLNPTDNENSHFRVFDNSESIEATGSLATIERSLKSITRIVNNIVHESSDYDLNLEFGDFDHYENNFDFYGELDFE